MSGARVHGPRRVDRKSVPKSPQACLFDSLPISAEQLDELIGMIYQGPLEAVPWGSALGALRRHLQANWATVILRPASASQPALLLRDGGHGAELYDAAYSHYEVFSLDPFVGLPVERVVTIDEMIDTSMWMRGEFYKAFIEPNQIRFILGADVVAEGGAEFRLRITRPPTQANFSKGDKALCQVLLSHLKRAVNLHARIDRVETERQLYAMAMDRMLVGTVVLDEKGAIIRCNSLADAILAEKDGVWIGQGGLHADHSNEERDLQRLLRVALAIPAGTPIVPEALSLTRPSGRAPLGILIRPIPLGEWSEGRHRPAVAAFIRDPERKSHPPYELLRQLFGLTAAEATLALLLANGLTLDEAAAELGNRKNTIRAHLRSIFSKTGVKRQTTLVHLLLSSVASIS